MHRTLSLIFIRLTLQFLPIIKSKVSSQSLSDNKQVEMPVDMPIYWLLMGTNRHGIGISELKSLFGNLSASSANLLHLSRPQFSHLEYGDDERICLLRLVTVNERLQVRGWPKA